MGCSHLTKTAFTRRVKVEIAQVAEVIFSRMYAMSSGANKPLILNQKITLGDKKRLSAISGTM